MKRAEISNDFYNSLAMDYIDEKEEIMDYYEYSPTKDEDINKRLKWIEKYYKQSREELVKILWDYNKKLNAGENTFKAIWKLHNTKSVAIVTGQQAGTLTGPLFTIYKAIATVLYAREIEEKWNVPAVPIFWIASEDHDFIEIAKVNYVAKNGLPGNQVLKKEGNQKKSIGHYPITDRVWELLDCLEKDLPDRKYKDKIIEDIRTLAAKSDNLAQWFGKLMAHFLNDLELVFVDPMLPGLRKMAIPFFQDALEKYKQVFEALDNATTSLDELSYSVLIDKESTNTQLFYYYNGERLPIYRQDNKCTSRQEEFVKSMEDISREINKSPESFSTNVVLRPILQDVLFPTLAYIAGPGEMAYYAQLKGVYGVFDMKMPIISPRISATLIPWKINKLMEKHQVAVEDIFNGNLVTIRNQEIIEKEPIGIETLFKEFEEQFMGEYNLLAEKIKVISPELEQIVPQNRERIKYQIQYLWDKTLQHHKRNHKDILKEYKEMKETIYPVGGLQERKFNLISFYIEVGPALIEKLIKGLKLNTNHQILFIGDDHCE